MSSSQKESLHRSLIKEINAHAKEGGMSYVYRAWQGSLTPALILKNVEKIADAVKPSTMQNGSQAASDDIELSSMVAPG